MCDVLDAEEIQRHLRTQWMGRPLEVRRQTGSTNDDCIALARAGAPAGTAVAADWQSAGRGRRGRRWTAPAGSAVLLSVVLRPALPAASVGRIGMAGALAVVEAVWRTCAVRAAVKYPNDVLVEGRKLAGVLPEVHLEHGTVEWAVLGIGVNVRRNAVPPDLRAGAPRDAALPATSLEEHTVPPDRNQLTAALLESLEERLERMQADPEALAAEWRACDVNLGRHLRLTVAGALVEGTAAAVDADGRLLIRAPDGTERWLLPGEVTLRREA